MNAKLLGNAVRQQWGKVGISAKRKNLDGIMTICLKFLVDFRCDCPGNPPEKWLILAVRWENLVYQEREKRCMSGVFAAPTLKSKKKRTYLI